MLKQLEGKIAEIHKKIDEQKGREKAVQKTPTKGKEFEDKVFDFIQNKWSQKAAHISTRTGKSPGFKGNNIGDVVIEELDPEHNAAGCKIVIEAKANVKFTPKKALDELKKARENREAEIGLFVCSASCDSNFKERFSRFGNDIMIVWDEKDENSDVIFEAGLSVAVALCVKAKTSSKKSVDIVAMNKAILGIENKVKSLDEITQSANNIQKASNTILEKSQEMRSDLAKQIGILKENI